MFSSAKPSITLTNNLRVLGKYVGANGKLKNVTGNSFNGTLKAMKNALEKEKIDREKTISKLKADNAAQQIARQKEQENINATRKAANEAKKAALEAEQKIKMNLKAQQKAAYEAKIKAIQNAKAAQRLKVVSGPTAAAKQLAALEGKPGLFGRLFGRTAPAAGGKRKTRKNRKTTRKNRKNRRNTRKH